MYRSLLAAALAVAPFAAAQADDPKPNPIAAQVKASLKDPSKPFTMLVRLKAKEDAGAKLEEVFEPAVKATLKEKGCIAYQLNRDTKDPSQYVLYERWKNLDGLEAHLKAEHITTLLRELGDLMAGPPELQVLVPVRD